MPVFLDAEGNRSDHPRFDSEHRLDPRPRRLRESIRTRSRSRGQGLCQPTPRPAEPFARISHMGPWLNSSCDDPERLAVS